MMDINSMSVSQLHSYIQTLEHQIQLLTNQPVVLSKKEAVTVPDNMKPLFDKAQQTVAEYFEHLNMDPSRGTIEINDQRYVLVRASALSKDFLDTIQKLYADRGEEEAMTIGKNFLFDIAHVIGMNDAKNFHTRMNLADPVAKLSAGPVHFAYTGWAYVDILPESNPSPDENFYLIYRHPYSFEADSWLRSGKKSNTPVCIMNAGYSSGWCEESFGIPLTAVEVSCTARGDKHCTFIMSPPEKMQQHVDTYYQNNQHVIVEKAYYEIPTFFDRKRVEEEMQRSRQLAEASDKSKTDFVANMSHELRTPLAAILGFTDLLQKTILNKVQKEYLEAIHTAGNSLLAIINDILDLSKLDAGKIVMEHIPFHIPDLIHSVHAMFAHRAKQKNLKFTCMADTAINCQVTGDPMRLTQMLVNLISNAIKFTDSGSVTVSCVVENETEQQVTVRFSVKDTGIGIPPEKSTEIFERFTQGDTDFTRKYGGTGLGLHITRQLAEIQNGSIELIKKEGPGAEFSFVIPYPKKNGNDTTMPILMSNVVAGIEHSRKVLIVEDNLMNQKLAAIILESYGYITTIAEHGVMAIEIMRRERFDIILMDIQMPEIDGYMTTRMLRSELGISTPVIAMTAHALAGEKDKCLQAGMQDYISKPFDEQTLLLTIQKSLQHFDEEKHRIESGSLISLEYLHQQTKGNDRLVKEMITIFIHQNPDDIENLMKAMQQKNYDAIYKIAHNLHNTIGFFGLHSILNEFLLRIEYNALHSTFNEDQMEDVNYVKQICDRAVVQLKVILDQNQ